MQSPCQTVASRMLISTGRREPVETSFLACPGGALKGGACLPARATHSTGSASSRAAASPPHAARLAPSIHGQQRRQAADQKSRLQAPWPLQTATIRALANPGAIDAPRSAHSHPPRLARRAITGNILNSNTPPPGCCCHCALRTQPLGETDHQQNRLCQQTSRP